MTDLCTVSEVLLLSHMTKTLTADLKKKMLSSKYKGIFPLQFDDDSDLENDTGVEIPDTIQMIPIGQWEHDLYGGIIITNQDIREFAQNYNAGVRKGVFITAGHEGFEELPAVGWITAVEIRDNGLWGVVEWNDGGKELLSDKAFKFFSPEFYRDYEDPQTHQLYRNVLIGGALTKSPYFKELEAIVFSESKLKKQFNETNTMDLNTILAKKVEELSTEEKAFVKEHAADLTDEQKVAFAPALEEAKTETDEEKTAREAKEAEDKVAADKATEEANIAAGLNADGSEKKIDASEKVTMSAMEFSILKKQADEGAKAFAEIKKNKLDTAVKTLVFSEGNKAGRFLPKNEAGLRTFMDGLNESQLKQFNDLVAALPKNTQAFSEIGKDVAVDGTAQAEVEAKINLKMSEGEKAGKPMKYSDALKAVMAENEGLEQRYDEELPSARRQVKA